MINLLHYLKSNPPKNGKYYLVAIDGRGGSGKTTLAEYVTRLLPNFTILNGDDYFEPTPGEVAWGAFNDRRFEEDVIKSLKQGRTTLTYRPYDWHRDPPITEQYRTIDEGVCIERCFSFGFNLNYDLKIWTETPPDIALERGQIRDNMPPEQGLEAWTKVWKPKEDAYIKEVNPLKTADIVIDGTKSFKDQVA